MNLSCPLRAFRWLPVLAALIGGSLPALRSAERLNVLLIVSDDLTACLGSYGNAVCRTPNLDRLAAQGVRFTRAYCQNPVCGPSRASFMSGLYPEQNGVTGNNYTYGSYRVLTPSLAEHPSIGGLLRRNGYVSMRVGKIFHMGIPGGIEAGDPGGDDPDSWDRAFNVMAPETASPGELEDISPRPAAYGTRFARVIVPDGQETTQADYLAASQAIAILETRSRVRVSDDRRQLRPTDPLFLAVGLIRPHVPAVAPKRLFDHYPPERIALPRVPPGDLDDVPAPAAEMRNDARYGMDERQQRQAIAAYYASVEFMDEQVGRLLGALDRLKLRERTIVIFTSDHGFHLGEHTLWQKTTLFEESLRVPLLVSAPGFQATAGAHSDALVELTDLYPTIADLAGLRDRTPANLVGRSLRPLLLNPGATGEREFAYSVNSRGGRSLRNLRWRYNSWGEAGEELYDLEQDPRQFTNLAGNPAHAATLAVMRAALDRKRQAIGPAPGGRPRAK
ncbi:sulfatase [Horticoccus sp. 23ND18S-11]